MKKKYGKRNFFYVLRNFRNFFDFSNSERKGISILILLITSGIAFYYVFPYFITGKKYDTAAFDTEINEFLKTQEIIPAAKKYFYQKDEFNILDVAVSSSEQKLNPFPFDPNQMTYSKWTELGLSDKQIRVIDNYLDKGGKFRTKLDFKKMYCISSQEYEILEPYIQIAPEPMPDKNTGNWNKDFKSKDPSVTVELNTASEEELMKVKGIGNYFASRIIQYRQKLGGYYNIDQLSEIPKMDSSKLNPIINYFSVNTRYIRKININSCTFEQLKAHPYIGYNIGLSLINYRSKHGNFSKVEDIKKSMLINEKNYFRISQYLCIE